jgi:hypothetical protein
MIRKNTKVVFEDGGSRRTEDLAGGIPLSKGEIVNIHSTGKTIKYEVVDKTVDCFLEGKDQEVNIIYVLRKTTRPGSAERSLRRS